MTISRQESSITNILKGFADASRYLPCNLCHQLLRNYVRPSAQRPQERERESRAEQSVGHGANKSQPPADGRTGGGGPFPRGAQDVYTRALPPEKGASLQGRSRQSAEDTGARRRWRRRDEERNRNAAWEPGGRERMHATPLRSRTLGWEGRRQGEASFATRREVAGDENRRRRLVVCRSLTRTLDCFSTSARRERDARPRVLRECARYGNASGSSVS